MKKRRKSRERPKEKTQEGGWVRTASSRHGQEVVEFNNIYRMKGLLYWERSFKAASRARNISAIFDDSS